MIKREEKQIKRETSKEINKKAALCAGNNDYICLCLGEIVSVSNGSQWNCWKIFGVYPRQERRNRTG